jgi:xanthine/uracil/vitamin C permease (AzgA family)
MIFYEIPDQIMPALTVGVVFWSVFVGLFNGNLLSYHPQNGLGLVNLSDIHLGNPATCGLVCFFTLFVLIILKIYKFDTAVLIAIFLGALFAIPLKVADVEILKENVIS